eukprot:TRINITY_DN15543_c0_g1_i1.p2 TRINITY_DN15543_c0_g1~~TRINITY_DN15543_c0_g1_i1.p2  ORF type:complete len:223 (+),score=73.49 TRINITY_DN15543_c0_g1_i1:109-777(+)
MEVGAFIRCVDLELCDAADAAYHGGCSQRARQVTVHTSARDGEVSVVRVANRMEEDDGVGVEVYYSTSAPGAGCGAKYVLPAGCSTAVEGPVLDVFHHPNALSPCSLREPLGCGVRITDIQQAFADFRITAEAVLRFAPKVLAVWCFLEAAALRRLPKELRRLVCRFLPHRVARLEIHLTAPRFRVDATSLTDAPLGSFTTALSHRHTASTCDESAAFSALA